MWTWSNRLVLVCVCCSLLFPLGGLKHEIKATVELIIFVILLLTLPHHFSFTKIWKQHLPCGRLPHDLFPSIGDCDLINASLSPQNKTPPTQNIAPYLTGSSKLGQKGMFGPRKGDKGLVFPGGPTRASLIGDSNYHNKNLKHFNSKQKLIGCFLRKKSQFYAMYKPLTQIMHPPQKKYSIPLATKKIPRLKKNRELTYR